MKVIDQIATFLRECEINPEKQRQHLSGAGSVFRLEEKLQNFYNKKFAVSFCNATAAIQAVCIALGIKNSEIISPSVTWGGSVAPLFILGNRIRFTSVDPFSFNMDENDLQSVITPRSKFIFSVDYGGTPANSKSIMAFSKNHGLTYISDSAQSFGSLRDNKPAGYFADITILSFSPGKSLFAGEGGAVLTDNESIYEKIIWFSQHPYRQKTVFGMSNINEYAPINGRINPLSAILLNETFESRLKVLEKIQKRFFKTLRYLNTHGLIEPMPTIKSPNSSTYFSITTQLARNVSVQELSNHLISMKFPFTIQPSSTKFIPFDKPFRDQFKGRFSCSKKLLLQKKYFSRNNKFILKYSPQLIKVQGYD